MKKDKLNQKKYEIFFIFDRVLNSYYNHIQMNLTLSRLSAPYHFAIKNASGNTVETDASTDIGGGDAALRPMELLLAGLSSCSSIDVVLLLQKMRQPLTDIRVDIKAERRQNETPSLFNAPASFAWESAPPPPPCITITNFVEFLTIFKTTDLLQGSKEA